MARRSISSLHALIADTIAAADHSYFFEDYSKQATAVLRAIKDQGFALVPTEPSEEMIEAGIQAIASGKVRPADHVRYIYTDMLRKVTKGK
jgi:hypothetical protein